MPTTKGQLTEELIAILSDDEIARLVQEMRGSVSKGAIRDKSEGVNFLKAVSARDIFAFLHLRIFGSWNGNVQYTGEKVMKSTDQVKDFISRLPPARVFKVKDEYPTMPQGLCIENEVAGIVAVTQHAWVRFIERQHRGLAYNPPDVIIGRMKSCFARSRPTALPRGYAARRIINNSFESADYFLDQPANIRFVVSRDSPKRLLTVEVP